MTIALTGVASLLHRVGGKGLCEDFGDFHVEGSVKATGVPW